MEYIGSDNQTHTPAMVHRAIFGSLERFIGILIEHTKGAFPVWISPVQAIILPITDDQNDYAQSVLKQLKLSGLRVETDTTSERLQKKIRNAQLQKIPYMLVCGEREANNNEIAVRLRTGEDLGSMKVKEFISNATNIIESKSKELWNKTLD
jgi:threonyl-tRNA synthetase